VRFFFALVLFLTASAPENAGRQVIHNQPDSEPPKPATLGNYTLLEKLGTGAWATVYKAQHRLLSRFAAVKILHRHMTLEESKQQRFKQEAENISRISDPHVVALIDYGFTVEKQPYLVMEYVDGLSLDAYLRENGKLSAAETIDITKQVCRGLQAAHNAGVIHRDLKPANLLLRKNINGSFEVKITDFGIAKTLDSEFSASLTKTGETMGTPSYMSPEQCLGNNISGSSDLYSLGCIIFEMLSGRPMVSDAKSLYECMAQHVEGKVPDLPPAVKVPANLEHIMRRALNKKPEDRFADASEMLSALEDPNSSSGTKPIYGWLAIAAAVVATIGIVRVASLSPNASNPPSDSSTTLIGTAQPDVAIQVPPNVFSPQTPWLISTTVGKQPPKDALILNLTNSGASDSDIRKLISENKNLKGLFLEHTGVTDDTMKLLQTACPDLEELHLRHTGITNEGLKYIAKMPSLKRLNLSYTKVDDGGMDDVGRMTSLDELSLSRTAVTDSGLAKLHKLKNLKLLFMINLYVSDESVALLANLPKLQHLNIGQTKFTGASFSKLPSSLRSLGAYDLAVTDDDVAQLKRKTRLIALDLTGSGITDKSLDTILAMKQLEALVIGRTRIGAEGMMRLKELPNLRSLTLNDLHVTKDVVRNLAKLPQLQAIDLSNSSISDDGIAELKGMPIAYIDLHSTNIGDAALATLSEIPTLLFLDAGKTRVTGKGLLQLAKLPKLKTLGLFEIPLTASERAALKEAMPNCAIK
jgi:serine/threonine protein kinase